MKTALYSIVSRCSVADSHRDVLTYAISRLKPSYWRAQRLSFRVKFARACRDLHNENSKLYRDIVRGTF